MTKYEWDSELKRNIHRLPKAEQERALEFYTELFEDKIESGYTESQIIAEFGNPCDVADKILAEYGESRLSDGETVDERPVYRPAKTKDERSAEGAEAGPSGGSAAPADGEPDSAERPGVMTKAAQTADRVLWGVGRVVRGTVGVCLWMAAVAAVAAAWILLIGGLALAALSFIFIASNALGAIANVGVGLVLTGLGLFGAAFTKRLFRWCRATAGVLFGKKEGAKA